MGRGGYLGVSACRAQPDLATPPATLIPLSRLPPLLKKGSALQGSPDLYSPGPLEAAIYHVAVGGDEVEQEKKIIRPSFSLQEAIR